MKKILFFTDSHSNFDNIYEMATLEEPDIIICGGDYSKDASDLSCIFEDVDFYVVDGNCDFFQKKYEDEIIFEIEDVKILLAHGHFYGVKSTYDEIRRAGILNSCDLVLFGHTHRYYLEKAKPTLYNPGAAKDGKYGIINIENKNITIHTKNIKNHYSEEK